MIVKSQQKEKAIKLRQKGYSLTQISNTLKIAKSSASVWTRNIVLSDFAQKQLTKQKLKGKLKAIKINHQKSIKRLSDCLKWATISCHSIKPTKENYQLICAMLYWGEGAKLSNRVEFTNSDPLMVKVFLTSLEIGFNIDKSKIKANLHLHQYHQESIQKIFWMKSLHLSESQFNKTFWKKNSHKVIRTGYPGCIRVCYYSKEIVDKIKALYQAIGSKVIGP